MILDGFTLGGYRSFGHAAQTIGPLQKVNLFAGQNNSGKSNILRFVVFHLQRMIRHRRLDRQFEALDSHISDRASRFVLGLALHMTVEVYEELRKKIHHDHLELFDQLLHSKTLSRGTDCVWVDHENISDDKLGIVSSQFYNELISEMNLQTWKWQDLFKQICPDRQGGQLPAWIADIVGRLDPLNHVDAIDAAIIPAVRQTGYEQEDPKDFSGHAIVNRLAALQNPILENHDDKLRFEKINNFLRSVTGDTKATLEIPHDRKSILAHVNSRIFPLESLGTGLHEVVIIAAAATTLHRHVLCIEEPEVHLHPILQRKLLQYLVDETDNQYIIATHSAHLLDCHPDVAVFHVSLHEGESRVKLVRSAKERHEICKDLGYRASDLMQTNAIIWVEGPSDRIYLRHWVSSVAPDLIEGTHYSIMFYGGRLLCHLSADDPEVTDFISLRRLNRNSAIVIDSDKAIARTAVNATKRRVLEEFDKGPGLAWITDGREIENYVVPNIMSEAVSRVSPGLDMSTHSGRFDRILRFKKGSTEYDLDKLKVAHAVVERAADLSRFDLAKQVRKLVTFIRASNS